MEFQSTHSQRVRPKGKSIFIVTSGISIHALTKSATYKIIKPSKAQAISIHALTKSATFISLN